MSDKPAAPSSTFLYFAYGSNMLTERLQARCPSAKPIGVASVRGWKLEFCKRSDDKSGKATLLEKKSSTEPVYGVLFEIAVSESGKLDAAEGSGYARRDQFSVKSHPDGNGLKVRTYLSKRERLNDSLKPYNWYRALIVAGATQHELPNDYTESLARRPCINDPDANRKGRKEAVCALNAAGYACLLNPPC